MRIQARQALIRLGILDTERDAMLGAMRASPDDDERLAAAVSLVQLGKLERAIPVLKELESRGDTVMRGRARWSLSLSSPARKSPDVAPRAAWR